MINIANWLRTIVRLTTLYSGGSGGGDGGAADRKAAEDARVAQAISQINQIFGIENATPKAVDRSAFMSVTPGTMIPTNRGWMPAENGGSVFDEAGYNAAVKQAQEEAKGLSGAAAGREQLYSTIGQDATNKATFDLNKDRDTTERELKFMLARAGLSGGSRDIDANRDVLDTYQQGVLKAADLGTAAANNARSADDNTRVNLINNIRAGLDQGDATQQAYESMRNNAKTAQDNANATNLGGFFDALRQQQQQSAFSQGMNDTINQYKQTPYKSTTGGDRGRTGSY